MVIVIALMLHTEYNTYLGGELVLTLRHKIVGSAPLFHILTVDVMDATYHLSVN